MDLDEEDYRQYDIREGIIFLIELNDDILKPIPELDHKSQLIEILSSINELLEQMIITLPNTGVGIYFYNCTKTSKRFKPESTLNRLFRLSDISATTMKLLNDLIADDASDFKSIAQTLSYNKPGQFPLHTIFGDILDEFLQKNSKRSQRFSYNRKRLIWFTNNDKPYNDDDKEGIVQNLRTVIDDFELHKIPITPIFLDKTLSATFDLQFYKDIFLNTNYLKNYNDKSLEVMNRKLSRSTLPQKIKSYILRLKQINRIQMACNLILSDGRNIHGNFGCSVRGYALYNHQKPKKLRHIYDKLDEFKIIELESTLKDADGLEIKLGDDIDKSIAELKNDANIRSGVQFQDTVFYLNHEQVDFLKNYTFDHDPIEMDDDDDENFTTANYNSTFTTETSHNETEVIDKEEDDVDVTVTPSPYLKLLGFRHISKFQSYYNSHSPVFITYDPFDGNRSAFGYKNSDKTFKNLYNSCIKLERYAILFGCTKAGSMPNLYAFYPTNLPKSSKIGYFPDGFLLIRLPWLDDIRSLPTHILNNEVLKFDKEDPNVNPKDIVSNLKSLIKTFTIKNYNPYELPNPSLNFFYKVIKYDLLQLDLEEDFQDLAKNDVTYRHVQQIYAAIKSDPSLLDSIKAINEQLNHYDSAIGKHSLAQEDHQPGKKQKIVELSDQDILIAWKNQKLNQFTLPQLKQFVLNYKQIKSATKKQDVIDNITEYLDKKRSAA